MHIIWVNVLIILRERRESSRCLVCRGSEGERERERKRLRVVRNGTLYFPFTEYHIGKVPVDVASFLVVNHVKYWCIVFGYVMFMLKSMVK